MEGRKSRQTMTMTTTKVKKVMKVMSGMASAKVHVSLTSEQKMVKVKVLAIGKVHASTASARITA